MNEKDIDMFLKQKARAEKVRIPTEVEQRISYVLKSLPRFRNPLRFAIAVVAALMVGVVSLSVISPTYAESLPILKSVFAYFGKSENYSNKQYLMYSTPINQSVTDQGYTITISEVAADDNLIVISYTVKGTKPFSNDFSLDPYLFGILSQGGKNITNATGQGKMLDDDTFAGYTSYFVGRDNLPDKLDLNFAVKQIDNTPGKWNFQFTISKQGTSKKSQVVTPSVTASLPNAKVVVSKVVMSPFANTVMLNVSYTKQPYHYGFFVLDDKGKPLYVIGEGQGTPKEQNVSFVKGTGVLNNITLIPFTYNSDYDLHPIEWLSQTTKVLPVELNPSNNTKFTIRKIKSNNNVTKIYYTIDGLYPYGYAVKIALLDNNGKVIYPGDSDILVDPETNEFVAEFNGLDPNMAYKVATPRLNDLIVFDQYKISVPLK